MTCQQCCGLARGKVVISQHSRHAKPLAIDPAGIAASHRQLPRQAKGVQTHCNAPIRPTNRGSDKLSDPKRSWPSERRVTVTVGNDVTSAQR
jgi:hypothetical protein